MVKRFCADLYKTLVGHLEFACTQLRYPPRELIVLCMHSTPLDWMARFGRIVEALLERFKPLAPAQLADYYAGLLSAGPYVLFTFDDGLRNNLHAARVLEQNGVRGMFFVVPGFVESRTPREFYRSNIRPVIDPNFDRLEEDVTPFGYADMRGLLDSGHALGCHTMTHLLRCGIAPGEADEEIVASAARLSEQLQTEVPAFCSPLNTLLSVDAYAKQKIKEHYRYHFTTFPGRNDVGTSPQLIFRRVIEVNWPLGKIRFALGRWDLWRWRGRVQQYLER